VVASFSTAGVEALATRLNGIAVVVLADSLKARKVAASLVRKAKGTLHLLLHDVASGKRGDKIIQLRIT
jgi:predicted dinucleotide-binding enzyme